MNQILCRVCSSKRKKKEKLVTFVVLNQSYSHGTVFLNIHHLPYSKQLCNFWVCLIVHSFTHTLHAYQHISLFSASTSETELRPQLHVLLHFPWQHDLTQGQLCFAAWIQIVTPHAECGSAKVWPLIERPCYSNDDIFAPSLWYSNILTLRWFSWKVFLKLQVKVWDGCFSFSTGFFFFLSWRTK